ncbi:AAA family ATPase [Bacteroides sp. OF04-15BH]|jgi:cytidylate kinase|uniref:cytidylate kinase-like family protein n=1 Tax=Bacteroides sp. OF04-15BH TaxID=2292281 RepID=UPI000E526C6F|nr:cytidylate kinase-like family protein [Bacteroides sp. OF04-15BH]RHP67028.1 cytidylate kinase-like family protein [Bacteroides sp. OF04-15BH]
MDNNKNFVLNIGRQLGSGGHAIGTILAKEFGIKFYDKEVLDLAAQESGFSKYFFERDDEHRGFVKSLFNSIIPFTSSGDPYGNQLSSESLFKFQSDAIKKAAEKESCVFVGRCADYVLRDHPRCVNIFISADMEDRVARLMQNLQVDAQEAEKRALEGDDKRASYYNYYSALTWGEAATYHICINSSVLGIEGTADFLKSFIVKKLGL